MFLFPLCTLKKQKSRGQIKFLVAFPPQPFLPWLWVMVCFPLCTRWLIAGRFCGAVSSVPGDVVTAEQGVPRACWAPTPRQLFGAGSEWPQASSFGEVIKPQFGGLMVCNSVWIHLHPTACRHIWYWKGQSFPIWLSSFWGTLLPSRNRHEPHRGSGLWYKHSVWGWVESYCTGADLKNLEQSHWSQPYCYLTYFCLTSEGFKPRDSSL